MTDEFDGQQPEYAPEPAYDDGGQAGGLNISDGIAQARAAYQPGDEILGPAYEGGYGDELPYEGEGFEGDYYDEGYAPEMSEADAVAELVDGRVREQIEPVLQAVEWDRRVREVNALADEFPQLRDPETMQAIEGELDELASIYGDAARSDPRLVRQALLAHEAEQALTAEQRRLAQTEQQSQQPRGPVLETGVGPGAATAPDDPVQAAYARALAGKPSDAYGFPLPS